VARNLSPKGASPKGLPARGPDDTDKALITALQRNGRESYAALAKVVGLSEAAVRQRVQRLLDDGVVQIVGVTDPMVMGFARWAMIGIVVEGDVRKVSDQLAAIDAIDYVVLTAGSFDLLVEVVCEDDESLLALLNDHIRSIPSVRSTETFMYLKLAKQTYAWGAR
jgi:Lrp/AsnC family transcriptional regulator for asnA, asnC and gidA